MQCQELVCLPVELFKTGECAKLTAVMWVPCWSMCMRRYKGHLKEDGANALHFNQLTDSWIKDVRFLNADSAIYLWGVTFSTVQDVDIEVTRCAN